MSVLAKKAIVVSVVHGDATCVRCEEEADFLFEVEYTDGEELMLYLCRQDAHSFLDLTLDKGVDSSEWVR